MNTIYKVTQPRHQRKDMKRKVLVVYLSNHVQRESAGQEAVTFMQAQTESHNF